MTEPCSSMADLSEAQRAGLWFRDATHTHTHTPTHARAHTHDTTQHTISPSQRPSFFRVASVEIPPLPHVYDERVSRRGRKWRGVWSGTE